MIGNSYTLCNKSSLLLQKLCRSAGKNVKVTQVAKHGASLEQHADPSTDTGKKIDSLLKNKKWDYVILQDRHHNPIENPNSLKNAVRDLAPRIKKSGAEILFFMTWAPGIRHKDYQTYQDQVKNPIDYQKKVASVYESIAAEVKRTVVPVGFAFMHARRAVPRVRLLRRDQSHPTFAGSYLMASTIYATLFEDPAPSYYATDRLRPSTAKTLLRVAKKTVSNYKKTGKDKMHNCILSFPVFYSCFLSLSVEYILIQTTKGFLHSVKGKGQIHTNGAWAMEFSSILPKHAHLISCI